jgi:hypothetical protein
MRHECKGSWIQIEHSIHVFEVDGIPHPETAEIYQEMSSLVFQIRAVGNVPGTSCIVQVVLDTRAFADATGRRVVLCLFLQLCAVDGLSHGVQRPPELIDGVPEQPDAVAHGHLLMLVIGQRHPDVRHCDGSHGLAENGQAQAAAGPPSAVLRRETQWPRPAPVEEGTLKHAWHGSTSRRPRPPQLFERVPREHLCAIAAAGDATTNSRGISA